LVVHVAQEAANLVFDDVAANAHTVDVDARESLELRKWILFDENQERTVSIADFTFPIEKEKQQVSPIPCQRTVGK
jgi:hypothetical protein